MRETRQARAQKTLDRAAAGLARAGFKVQRHTSAVHATCQLGLTYVVTGDGRWHAKGEPRVAGNGIHGIIARASAMRGARARIDRIKTGATIFADAAYASRDHLGGWGAWIRVNRDEKGITTGGALRAPVPSSIEAEIRAIANALHVARPRLVRGMAVMVQSDCITALAWILAGHAASADRPAPGGRTVHVPRRLSAAARQSQGLRVIRDIAAALHLVVLTRHVEGHKGQITGRHAVNTACDRIAKFHLRGEQERQRGQA